MPEGPSSPELRPAQAPLPEQQKTPERFDTTPPTERPVPSIDASERAPMPSTPAAPRIQAPLVKDPILQEVESILSDGLSDAYASMDPITQREFKEEGETAAVEITGILEGTKIQIRKILGILSRWLKLIPGVSRLFVEQEAKIKTDRLLGLRRDSEDDQ